MTSSNPTLAAARAKEQELYERDQEAVRAVIERDHADDKQRLLEQLGLVDYECKCVRKEAMRRNVTTDEVLRLYHNGHTPTAIGRILGIARSTVWHHLNKGRA